MSDDPRWQMIVAIRASGGADFETARRWEAIALEEHDHLIAAAREEGRREGEAAGSVAKREAELWRNQYNDLRASVEALLAHESAAHAAQLVALREGCAAAAGWEASGRVARVPLPDAEDALADAVRDTRIDTVRWCHANPVETSQAYEVEPADQYVARALNALGGGA